jgi:tripartite-type tricarboxylate transporter receptor subunit TctC
MLVIKKLFFILLLFATSAWASDRPIRLMLIWGGGIPETLTRLIQPILEQELNRRVNLEFKPGAGGVIGIRYISQNHTDDVVISMIDTVSLASIINTNPEISIDDFSYIVQMGTNKGVMLAVPKNSPLKNIESWKSPRSIPLAVGINGMGSTHHFYHWGFVNQTRTPTTEIFYKGSTDTLNNLLGGELDAMWGSVLQLEPYEKSGKLDVVAVTGRQRLDLFPNVPTFRELGIKMPAAGKWMILSNNSADTETLHQVELAFANLTKQPNFTKLLAQAGLLVEISTGNQAKQGTLEAIHQQSEFSEYVKNLKK